MYFLRKTKMKEITFPTMVFIIVNMLDQYSFLSVKTELLVDFEPKLKWNTIVILNNISWVHILLSKENNVVYSFAQIE